MLSTALTFVSCLAWPAAKAFLCLAPEPEMPPDPVSATASASSRRTGAPGGLPLIIPFARRPQGTIGSSAAIHKAVDGCPDFCPSANDFAVDNARFLCELSLAAYETRESRIRRELADRCVTDCRLVDCSDSDTQALVCRAGRAIIVAFRGTEPTRVKDLMTDLNVQFVPGPMGLVHRGFLIALEAIWDRLLDAIAARQDGKRLIWFTGHSLGGALAQLAVARMIRCRRMVQGLYTFGAPRCGNAAFAKDFDRQARHYTFRLVNEQDVVPKVAPRLLGYEHAGRNCVLDDNGRLLIDSQDRDDLISSLSDAFTMIFDGEDDHSLELGYLPKLAALAPQEHLSTRVAA